MVRDTGFEPVTPTVSRSDPKEDCHSRNVTPPLPRFINPHRLFHGVWMPQWLEERREVSEKAKKLYAYLTYFAGGKGCAWPSFNQLAEKLHISRRYVIQLVKEPSSHDLISVTNVNEPAKGYCTNLYRFLWHPWMQTAADPDFRLVVREERASISTAESTRSYTSASETQITIPSEQQITSPSEQQITSPSEQEITSPSEPDDTSPGELQITP
jgi:hypothetical protein